MEQRLTLESTQLMFFWSALNLCQRIPDVEFSLMGKVDINILLLSKLYGPEWV